MSVTIGEYGSFIESAASEWVTGISEFAQQLATGFATEAEKWTAIAEFQYRKFEALQQSAQAYAAAAAAAAVPHRQLRV